MKNSRIVRLGAVSYLNTKPLITFLGNRLQPDSRLSLDLPSRLAEQLESRAIDVGLIPAIEFFRGCESQNYRIVSDACIACLGPVHSVRLFFRVPPDQVRSMAVDEGSRTSIALASILLHDRFGKLPTLRPLPIDADPEKSEADAVLVIGDRAMHPHEYQSFIANWDLGDEWLVDTGLPFVFAMWVGRADSVDVDLARCLEEARDEGVAAIDELAKKYAATYRLSISACRDYLGRHLRFTLTADAMRGLELFHRKAVELNLTESLPGTQSFDPITSHSLSPGSS